MKESTIHLVYQRQYYDDEEQYLDPINDPSALGQRAFVDELLWMAGYVPEKIEIYQTLPNNSRVYRVKLDSVNGGFIFIRWDKKKNLIFVTHYVVILEILDYAPSSGEIVISDMNFKLIGSISNIK